MAVDRGERYGILGIDARRDRGSVWTQPPVFDQQYLVAIDGDRLALLYDQREGARRPRLTVTQQPEVAQERARLMERNLEDLDIPRG